MSGDTSASVPTQTPPQASIRRPSAAPTFHAALQRTLRQAASRSTIEAAAGIKTTLQHDALPEVPDGYATSVRTGMSRRKTAEAANVPAFTGVDDDAILQAVRDQVAWKDVPALLTKTSHSKKTGYDGCTPLKTDQEATDAAAPVCRKRRALQEPASDGDSDRAATEQPRGRRKLTTKRQKQKQQPTTDTALLMGEPSRPNEDCEVDSNAPSTTQNGDGKSKKAKAQKQKQPGTAKKTNAGERFPPEEARIATEMPAKFRLDANGDGFKLFPALAADCPDFSDLSAEMKHYSSVQQRRMRIGGSSIHQIPAHVLLSLSLNDYNGKTPHANGFVWWAWAHAGADLVYYFDWPWSAELQHSYRSRPPVERFRLGSLTTAWPGPSAETMALPVLVSSTKATASAKGRPSSGDSYTASFEISTSERKHRQGCLLVIILPDEFVVTDLEGLHSCAGRRKTGGMCAVKDVDGGISKVEWEFAPASDAYRSWADDRRWNRDADLANSLLSSFATIAKASNDKVASAAATAAPFKAILKRTIDIRTGVFQGS